MSLQKEVRRDFRSEAEISADSPVTISVTLHPDVAHQLAQFAKRSTFDTFYQFTEAHLPHDEREKLAYQMISGINSIGGALADVGHKPR